MTPKEKATELTTKYRAMFYGKNLLPSYKKSIICSIIAVTEIIKAVEHFGYVNAMFDDFENENITTTDQIDPCEYWEKVLSELRLLK